MMSVELVLVINDPAFERLQQTIENFFFVHIW